MVITFRRLRSWKLLMQRVDVPEDCTRKSVVLRFSNRTLKRIRQEHLHLYKVQIPILNAEVMLATYWLYDQKL